jgi:hypothetical protein
MQVMENKLPGLLADDGIQPPGQVRDLLSDGIAHARGIIGSLAGEATASH